MSPLLGKDNMEFKLPSFQNFGEVLRASAKRFPEKTAIVHRNKSATYQELEEASNRVASALALNGIVCGDKVGIVASNRIEYLEIVFGCAKLGAVIVKLNWRLAPRELLYLIRFNQVKLLFYSYQNPQWCQELCRDLQQGEDEIRLVGLDLEKGSEVKGAVSYPDLLCQGSPEYRITFPGGEAPLMHLHTSGTTGFPKCVVYAHKRYINHVAANAYALGFRKDMIFQTMSQMFHSASLGIYASIFVGAKVVLFDHFDVLEYLRAAEREKVTRLSSVPTVLYSLIHSEYIDDFDLHTVRTIGYGSAPMPQNLIEMTIERLNGCDFMQSYGMTEMGATVTILSPEDHLKDHYKHLGSVGKPIPGVRLRIVGEDGQDCPVNDVGEIVLKGYNMMLEYWRMPEETGTVLKDGWYYSGDMGFVDEDGFLTITGRKKDLIITGAENVYPAEVEQVLERHEAVAAVCVFGLPDPYWGERVTACVVRKEGHRVTSEELRTYCRGLIAGYKIPKQVEFADSLPVNSLGKVDKKELIRRFTADANG